MGSSMATLAYLHKKQHQPVHAILPLSMHGPLLAPVPELTHGIPLNVPLNCLIRSKWLKSLLGGGLCLIMAAIVA